jgi:penicillin-binding protein 1A
MGFPIPNEEQPSLALGAIEVSLQDLVLAYSAFANYGDIPEPVLIEGIYDNTGKQIYHTSSTVLKKAMSVEAAGTMNKMLVNAVNEGTGKAMKSIYGVDSEIAGKTGTSQDYSDAWFISYTEDMVCGVWVGAMSPSIHFQTGANGSGSTLALPIAGMLVNEMEESPTFSDDYLTGFNPVVIDSAFFECDTVVRSPGFLNFLDKLFNKRKQDNDPREISDTVAKKDTIRKDGKVKSWFKKIFKKKKEKP